MKKTLLDSLGITIKEVHKGKVVATMPVDERTKQPFGLLHGGATVALAETVASAGGYELVDQQTEAVVGQEINANHIRSKRDGIVIATATILHHGKTSMVWEVKVTDEQDKLISICRCTLAIIKIN